MGLYNPQAGLNTVAPATKLGDFMSTDVIRVRTDADQEEVARLVARYNLLAIPLAMAAFVLSRRKQSQGNR